ncbi:kinase-like domain-containing protein [Pholiota molesta]|nr:kinase-like domain-containing protein [Pholiota molesta]
MLTDLSLVIQALDRSGAHSPQPNREGPSLFESAGIESGRDEEKAHIIYNGYPHLYDTGKHLTVLYRRNENEPDAVENRLFASDEWEKPHFVVETLIPVMPSPSLFYHTITCITLHTENGILTTTISEDVDEIVPYLPIPPHLSHISTVPISELQKVRMVDMDVDRVKWNDQTLAFKRTGENLEGTLRELEILDRLRGSPNIIDLTAIVVNQDNTIRGFLMPFMRAGNLSNVFSKVREDLGVPEDDDKVIFDWSIKHAWALQITEGVVELHAISAYNGDLKPTNVVIGPAGQAILIDFLPIGFSNDFAAPEVLAKEDDWPDTTFESLLSGPSDVYSLGIVLYALTQENVRGVRVPTWKFGNVPSWYRDIVERCLHLDPSSRPSAAEVLSILQKGEQ